MAKKVKVFFKNVYNINKKDVQDCKTKPKMVIRLSWFTDPFIPSGQWKHLRLVYTGVDIGNPPPSFSVITATSTLSETSFSSNLKDWFGQK